MNVPNYDLYLKRIKEKIADLEQVLVEKDEVIATQQAEKEEIQREQWNVQREARTAQYQSEDFTRLENVNGRLRERDQEVQHGLRELQAKIKTLSAHLKQ